MTFKYLTIVALFLTATLVVEAQSKDDTAIRAAIDRMTTAQSAYDSAALDSIFTSDYIEISPVGEFDPRAKVLTFYTPAEKEKAAGVMLLTARHGTRFCGRP